MVRRLLMSLAMALTTALWAPGARAQSADSARVGPSAPTRAADAALGRPDSLHRPPVSPRTALLESLALPGWGQASLHRSTAGGLFAALEIGSIAMLIQSKKELNIARAAARDSVLDPAGTGTYVANPLASRVRPRKQAVEDWTALLIATHLFAAADAFVAAHLWDVPVEVGSRADVGARSAAFLVRIPF